MPGGIPGIPAGTAPAIEMRLPVRAAHTIGETPYGMRRALELGTGTVSGSRFSGTVLDGGIDYDLTLANGVTEIEQLLLVQSRDGAWSYLRTCGVAGPGGAVRLVPKFDVAVGGTLASLDTTQWVGTRNYDAAAGVLTLAFYEVPPGAAVADGSALRIQKPAGVPAQSWECVGAVNPGRGPEVFREIVELGPMVSVGNTSRGTRTAIPITGGPVSGRVRGEVLPSGADFQLLDTLTLDARYMVKTDDGEVITVRNCGSFVGGLVPTFEARVDGNYAYLNEPKFLSDPPGVGLGTVTIVIRDRL